MLFMILGARRKQVLLSITVDNIVVEEQKIVFLPSKALKHTNTRRPLQALIYYRYTANNKLCIVDCLLLRCPEKINRCECDRIYYHILKATQTGFVGHYSRWIKNELGKTGINTNVYTTHSCRAASISQVRENCVSIAEDLERGCWKSENTFRAFYSKDNINQNSREDFNFV